MPQLIPRTWIPRPDAYGPRAARQPFVYQAYVPDLIAEAELRLSADVVGAIEKAAVAVRDLQVGPNLAGLESISRPLLRSEALASSRIEGLEISHRRIAKALVGVEPTDDTARSVIGNILAMEEAIRLASEDRPFVIGDLLAVHQVLMVLPRERPFAGALRREQNWIGHDGDSPRNAEFVPPPEDEVPRLLEDLVAFIGRDDLSPIAQAAICHAQFETIHPFADGNGRVGRALVQVVLRRRGLAPRFVPPVSVILATNRRRYVGGLTAYRDGQVDAWCGFFARALQDAATESEELGRRVAELQSQWRDRAGRPRRDSAAQKLIAGLAAQPIVDVRAAQRLAGVSFPAANAGLRVLEAAGILKPVVLGRHRNRAWEAPDVLALLDRFDAHTATPTQLGERRRPAPREPQG